MTLLEPPPLDAAPAPRRRRVGEVDDEREDGLRALGSQRLVELADDSLVAVGCQRVLGVERA